MADFDDPRSQATPPRVGFEPADGTVLRPRPGVPPQTPDLEGGTVLRPTVPGPVASPDEGTVLRPRPVAEPVTEGTVLRPDPAPHRPAPPETSWKHTGTPTTLPPVTQAHQVPTYPAQGRSRFEVPDDLFVAPPEQVKRERRPVPWRLLLSWLLALVLIASAAAVVYVKRFRQVPEDDSLKLPTVSSSASVRLPRGDEVVRRYLNALATGDVAAALSLGQTGGKGSAALLNARAYAQSLQSAPITDIQVPTLDAAATTIPAKYKLGGTEVSTKFQVVKQDDGNFVMAKTTVTFLFQGTSVQNVPLRINGVAVDWDTPMELLPGRYTISTGLPYITFPNSDALTVVALAYGDQTVHPLTPTLTDAGRTAFLDAVRTSLNRCLARKELSPANCPNSASSAARVVDGATRWTLVNDPWSKAKPGLSPSDQSLGDATFTFEFRLYVQFPNGGNNGNQALPARLHSATAVMTVPGPEHIKVRWNER